MFGSFHCRWITVCLYSFEALFRSFSILSLPQYYLSILELAGILSEGRSFIQSQYSLNKEE